MTQLRKSALVCLGIMVCCVFSSRIAYGQRSERKPESEPTLRIDTTLVSVPVIVSDRQGHYIGGLKASDFTLYEDHVKQPVDFFADTEEPINVALLLDTSWSTKPVLDDIKSAAKEFVKQLRSQDRAMVVSFNFDERALCELTSDRKTLERAIGNVRIGERPGTKLRDAVYDVMREEFKNVKGRKAIILLTDGKDHGSEVTERELLDGAAEADTLIYSVFYLSLPGAMGRNPRAGRGGWGNPRLGRRGGIFAPMPRYPNPPPQRPEGNGRDRHGQRRGRMEERNEDAREFLQHLSEVSAGRYYSSEVTNLKKTFEQIVEELRHQYRLGFYPTDHPADHPADHQAGSIHSIKVEVARPDVIVRSRRSYRTAGKAQSE